MRPAIDLLSFSICFAVFGAALNGPLLAAELPSVSDIRARNDINMAAVKQARFEEILTQEYIRAPGSAEADRASTLDLAAAREPEILADALSKMANASESERQRVTKDIKSRTSQMDASITIAQLNDNFALRQVYSVDWSKQRSRLDRSDLRDLAAVTREISVTEFDMMALDQTMSTIQTMDSGVMLVPRANKLAVQRNTGSFDPDIEVLRFGVLPKAAFDSSFSLSIRERVPGWDGQYILEGASKDRVVYQAILSRSLGYRIISLRYFDNEGKLYRNVDLSGYKELGGVPVPFHAIVTKYRQSHPGDRIIEERIVSKIDLNDAAAISDEVFQIPADYRVQRTDGNSN